LPERAPENASAVVTDFKPESFTIVVNTPTDSILSVSHPDYPGWRAMQDDDPVPILRAYGGLSAVEIPAGQHTIRFVYDPTTFKIGAILSLVTWGAVGILAVLRVKSYEQ
jgi:uncharacterized membrane protein YfhO